VNLTRSSFTRKNKVYRDKIFFLRVKV